MLGRPSIHRNSKDVHIKYGPIKNSLAGYIERNSKRNSGCQDVVHAGCPFARIVDGIQERRVDTLHDEEGEHCDEQDDLASDGHLLPGCSSKKAVVGVDNGRQ